MNTFKILSLNVSEKKGTKKTPVDKVALKTCHGIVGDAHAGDPVRQVSLLAQEDINILKAKGLEVAYGDFAENITTLGADLASLPIGTEIRMGNVLTRVSQIGKVCHDRCAIFRQMGDCVMPRRGIFVTVESDGEVTCESPCTYSL
jgi:MOSC domain-containing protein YiiM